MRTGILANSLPVALNIYDDLQGVADCDPFILLCSPPEASRFRSLSKHLARLLLRPGRLRSLSLLLRGRIVLFENSLDHPDSLARLAKLKLDIGLHRSGIIYRRPTISAFRLGILNPHIGILPEYRGRSVMEWALIQGEAIGISVFFVDEGIDTGERIVLCEEVDISHCRSVQEAKEYLFNLDAIFFRRALEALRSSNLVYKSNDGSGRRYFVMSKLFQSVVQNLIVANN
jgi:formyl transferase-like protein